MKKLIIASREQTGFGLIELMIAMTLGLVLLGGIGYVFLGSRGAFRTTDNLSRIQENARYALEIMSRDIRMAGYIGCGNIASMTVTNLANPPVPPLNGSNALIGYAGGSGWTNPTSITQIMGPDVLSIMGAFGNGANLAGPTTPSATLKVSGNPDGFKKDDVLVLTNCSNADVFKVTNTPLPSGTVGAVTLTHATSTNTGNRVGTYTASAFVMRVDQHSYFIGTNPAGNPALYRVGLDAVPEELVENVYDMQMRYGLDTTGDGAVDSYVTAPGPGTWTQVVSVTVNLLMRSPDSNIATAAQSVTFNNTTFNASGLPIPADRTRLYQVFSSTVGVRNRLPAL